MEVLPRRINRIQPPKELRTVEEEKEEDEKGVYKFDTSFKDVIGLQKIKDYLNDHVGLAIKRKDLFAEYDLERTMGLILYGPPGTGKTHIIRAMSGEYKTNVILASIAEIISSYTGETEKNIKNLFQKAKAKTPCILFFDELDSLGIKRDKAQSEGTGQVMQNAVNQLLMEMDGIINRGEDIFVIGATNRPWDIDPALKRGGRFETQLYMRLPGYRDRIRLFEYYFRHKHLPEKVIARVSLDRLARATMGYSPSDIERICRQAKMEAIRRKDKTGKTQVIRTGLVLLMLRDKETGKSGIVDWFNSIYKDQMQKMNQKDEVLYSQLIADTKKMKENAFRYECIRFLSMYVI
jgi:SpoVK/Ycf46/Vps4 family AAA+-type ATPase